MAREQLRGVNLGGWLVLEKWITPSLFSGLKAADEYTFCQETGAAKRKLLKEHRDTFITETDFLWIVAQGMNSVRLPIGHWAFGGFEPFVECEEYIDKAFDWAEKYELRIVLDLHTAPGSQNGQDHSGQAGETKWHLDKENIDNTLKVIEKIAKKYGKHPSLYGIELLNEPSREIPFSSLLDYYQKGYEIVRASAPGKAVIASDAYRPIAEWEDFIKDPGKENLLLDMHLYQLFSEEDKALSFEGHIAKTFKWGKMIEAFGANNIIVGEWSAMLHGMYENMEPSAAKAVQSLYAQAQLFAFQNTRGAFYWNYKTESKDAWNFRFVSS